MYYGGRVKLVGRGMKEREMLNRGDFRVQTLWEVADTGVHHQLQVAGGQGMSGDRKEVVVEVDLIINMKLIIPLLIMLLAIMTSILGCLTKSQAAISPLYI